MEKRSGLTITRLLTRYAILCICGAIFAVFMWWFALTLAISSGFVTRADEGQAQAAATAQALKEAGTFDESLVEPLCGWALFDADGSILKTSLTGKNLKEAVNFYNNGTQGGNLHARLALSNGDCVLQYRIAAQYSSAELRKSLPDFEVLALVLLLSVLVLLFGSATIHYGRVLKKRIKPLSDTVLAIADGKLDAKHDMCGIREYDEVLGAVDTLKTSLKASLDAQWSMEHARLEQTNALAHDLRTPLTVIDGNAQLLEETALTAEQKQYIAAIQKSAADAQIYVEKLKALMRAENPSKLNFERVDGRALADMIKTDVSGVCGAYNARLIFEAQPLPSADIAKEDFRRAVINIAENAAERSVNGTVTVKCTQQSGLIEISIEDSGNGFSKQALSHAFEMFFTENAARTQNGHSGIGLAYAQTIAQKHGGSVHILNSASGHGVVVLSICCVAL